MTYRVNIPDGAEAVIHMTNHVGTSKLIESRKRLLETIYDAPETSLTPREREAMRILFAVRSGCPFCSGARLWRDKPGFSNVEIEEEFYRNAMVLNLEWPGFSARERLLLEFADRFDRDIDGINEDDALWERMHGSLSETEIGDLVIMLGGWVGMGRAIKALGVADSLCVPLGQKTSVSYDQVMNAGRGELVD
jgi:hypothetical protein